MENNASKFVIHYKLQNLDNDISRMKDLKAKLDGICVDPSDSSYAKGSSMDVIKEYDSSYVKIKEALGGLIDDTADLMTRIRKEIELSDKSAAEQMIERLKMGGFGL